MDWAEPAVLTYVLGNPVHHGVVRTAEELETYAWTAYPEILGRSSPGLVDARETLALVHPDPAVARWRAERAGVDLCEEPGCLGEKSGQDRGVRATDSAAADGAQLGEKACPLPRVHRGA